MFFSQTKMQLLHADHFSSVSKDGKRHKGIMVEKSQYHGMKLQFTLGNCVHV